MREVASNRINIGGNTLSKSVAESVLKEHGLKPTKANLEKLVGFAKDRDQNSYLKRDELTSAAAKLAKELGQGSMFVADQPIAKVIAAAPQSLSRYQFSLEDTDGNKSLDMLRIIAVPLREQAPRDPRIRAMGGAPRAKSVHEQIGHDWRGNITLQFANDDGKLAPFKNGKWVTTSFRDALAGRPDAKNELARLKAAGYDLNAQRDILAVSVKGTDQPFVFALRGPQDQKAPGDEAARVGGGRMMMPQQGIDKRDYGFVSVCTEVQVENWGAGNVITVKKPVIYVYPDKKTNVRVTVDPRGEFSAQYPATKDGTWEMIATPDGTLFDPKTEKRYSYLFWEALNPGHLAIDRTKAHLVRGDEVETFLERAAMKFGLNDKERTDFVSFWVPALVRNPLSLVQFLDAKQCDSYATLTVEPMPDAELRLFMLFQRVDQPVKVGAPELPELRRGKFTVVEWGGANLDE